MELFIRVGQRYREATPEQVLEVAAGYQLERFARGETIRSPVDAKELAASQLRHKAVEHFAALFLDARHRVIAWESLFTGTIDGASVYPRVVVNRALHHNAAALVFAHNHPSGDPQPSEADRQITRKLQRALDLIDVRVLDHLVVGVDVTSIADCGGW